MKIKIRKKKNINALESGSLSDLAFLLIIFFIVIAVFNVNMGFLLELPRQNSSKIVNTQDIIRVTIEADGQIICDNEPSDIKKLRAAVEERIKVRPNMTLFLLIDPEVEYQTVVSVVEVIRSMQVENFSFRMRGS